MPGSAKFLLSHYRLLWRTTLNDLRGKHAGSLLGLTWAVLGPWLLLALYAVVYLHIFRVRVEGLSPPEYVLFVFCGLVPFFMMAESLTQGLNAVIANKAVLENTVFPIDLAPAKAVLSAQTSMVAGVPVIIVAALVLGKTSWLLLGVPVLWLLQVLAVLGLTWVLSLITVVFRDISNIMSVVLMALLIASPFAYTIDMVPENLQLVVTLNPFAYYVRSYQHLVVLRTLPQVPDLIFVTFFSMGLFLFGSWFFSRAKRVLIDYV